MLKTETGVERPIQEWVEGLAEVAAREFKQQTIQDYIVRNNIIGESLQPYTYFSSKRYTRNLIFKNELFECLAVCWDIGQSSPIHDHNGRMGWMYLADGKLFVQNYHVEDHDASCQSCRLTPSDGTELGGDSNTVVDKDEDVHMICNLPRFNQRAISVHIYEQPMTHCEIYSLQKGSYEVVKLSYTSEYGKLNPGVEL